MCNLSIIIIICLILYLEDAILLADIRFKISEIRSTNVFASSDPLERLWFPVSRYSYSATCCVLMLLMLSLLLLLLLFVLLLLLLFMVSTNHFVNFTLFTWDGTYSSDPENATKTLRPPPAALSLPLLRAATPKRRKER